MKKRIEFIDLAKGFCIILVVFTHIMSQAEVKSFPASEMLKIFRMPLYFVLSGLFFKPYENFNGFLKRKINKLLIPFLFFYYLITVGLTHFMFFLNPSSVEPEGVGWGSLLGWLYKDKWPNNPIWFLWSLFLTNILFYFLFYICGKVSSFDKKRHILVLGIISFILGYIGYSLGKHSFNLPAYIDTTLSVVPFFYCGYVLKQYTNILYPSKYDKYLLMVIIFFYGLTYMLCGNIDYRQNAFYGLPWINVFLCGILGTIATIFLAKLLRSITPISYIGRYSIMVLTTHFPIMRLILIVLGGFHLPITLNIMVTTIVTLGLYSLIIPFMKRFLPYVTAQKDVIKV